MISVVIPLDSYGQWAREAINSCVNDDEQLEIILVLSKTISAKMNEIKSDYPSRNGKSFNVFVQGGIGLSSALNEAVFVSSHELIARLDSDDILAVGRLKLQKDFLLSNPNYVAVGGQVELIDALGNGIRKIYRPISDSSIRKQIVFGNCFTHSAMMFRKRVFDTAGGYNVKSNAEDFELWSNMITIGKMANLPALACYSRIHEKQISVINSNPVSASNYQIIQKNILFFDHKITNLEGFDQLPFWMRFAINLKTLAFYRFSEARKLSHTGFQGGLNVMLGMGCALVLWPTCIFRYMDSRRPKSARVQTLD